MHGNVNRLAALEQLLVESKSKWKTASLLITAEAVFLTIHSFLLDLQRHSTIWVTILEPVDQKSGAVIIVNL